MIARPVVALYGESLFMAGLEARLACGTGLEIVHAGGAPADTADRQNAILPDVVLFDLDTCDARQVLLGLLHQPGLIMIGLSPKGNRAVLCSSQPYTLQTTNDLLDVIEGRLRALA
ncbi:MAG: hypothetical protein ACM3ZC_06280 [Bacteroidota bacterium]